MIEITENELVSGDPAIHEALAALRARGARLAVDDTGAGYAGLTHVMRLQPDIIKLDRALTTGVDIDPAKAPLISSFVRYARDIDADVCAEGVETLAELERLADLDVAYGQGYGIARPSRAVGRRSRPEATAACLHSFQATLRTPSTAGDADHDRRLELLARRLAAVTTREELEACLAPLADELQADEVRLVGAGASRARRSCWPTTPRPTRRRRRPARAGFGSLPHAPDHPRRRRRRPPRGLRARAAPVEPLPDRPRPRDRLPARSLIVTSWALPCADSAQFRHERVLFRHRPRGDPAAMSGARPRVTDSFASR